MKDPAQRVVLHGDGLRIATTYGLKRLQLNVVHARAQALDLPLQLNDLFSLRPLAQVRCLRDFGRCRFNAASRRSSSAFSARSLSCAFAFAISLAM